MKLENISFGKYTEIIYAGILELHLLKHCFILYTGYPNVARALAPSDCFVQPLGRVRARTKVSCIQSFIKLSRKVHDLGLVNYDRLKIIHFAPLHRSVTHS